MPELIESSSLELGLLNEIWSNCLFQNTIEAPNIDVTPEFDQNSSKYFNS